MTFAVVLPDYHAVRVGSYRVAVAVNPTDGNFALSYDEFLLRFQKSEIALCVRVLQADAHCVSARVYGNGNRPRTHYAAYIGRVFNGEYEVPARVRVACGGFGSLTRAVESPLESVFVLSVARPMHAYVLFIDYYLCRIRAVEYIV